MKQGWQLKKLSDVGKVYNGNSINAKVKKDKYINLDDGLPYIATKDVAYDSVIEYNNGVKIPFEEKNKFKTAPSNTVLICAEGGSAGRKIGITGQEVCFGNKLFAFSAHENIYSRFAYYYFFSSMFQVQFANEMAGIIGGVSMNKFKDITISFPPLPEQQLIVSILDEAFEAIAKAKANAEQNFKNAKELFENYLQELFLIKGSTWEQKYLDDICTKITDGVHKKPTYVSDGIPFIKINNLTEGSEISFNNVSYITKEDHKEFCKRTKPEKGDILITKDGTIGVVRVIETDIEFSIFVSVALIKPKSKEVTPFLKYVLVSPLIQNQIKPKGAALKHLYLTDLRKMTIPFPPLKEQQIIVQKLDALSVKTKHLEAIYQKKMEDLEELKKSILQKAFKGELT